MPILPNLFLVSWAEMAQSKPLSVIPSFRRSLLNPRRPGSYHPSLDEIAEQLSLLQTLASSGGIRKRTKLESLSAFLWKMVAKSAVMENANKKICRWALCARLPRKGSDQGAFLGPHRLGGGSPSRACFSKKYTAVAVAMDQHLVVSSGQRFPASKVDFGWGDRLLGHTIFHGVGMLGT
ncbi:hypothetical protein CK203_053678 [Vitis vinifera]|uniref:Uncharacterized protein n=1 Tax=Vitis vinifera TaxID=29760 RepID=A0A438GS22_VITVI|nr:hypothetical protein CK203_053678 [Vitis vinifera]